MGEVREGGFQVKSALACVGSNDLRRALRDAVLKVISPKYHKNSTKTLYLRYLWAIMAHYRPIHLYLIFEKSSVKNQDR